MLFQSMVLTSDKWSGVLHKKPSLSFQTTNMMQSCCGLGNEVFKSIVVVKGCVVICFIWTLVAEVTCKNIGPQRFEDQPFPPHTVILNENVTCGTYTPGKFVAPTYTCADLRVNGHRLAYGYYAGWAVGQEDQRCQETSGVHEFAQLCLMLLKSISVDNLGFKAAYVPKSTCAYINETRKLLKKVSGSQFKWTDFKPGWGWTETIQCMTAGASFQ